MFGPLTLPFADANGPLPLPTGEGYTVRMRPRFELRQDSDGLWSVIDIFTSRPALVDGVRQVQKNRDEADAVVARMNGPEAKRFGKK